MFKIPVKVPRSTIYGRLVITYLVVLIPIIVLGAYLYKWTYHNASQEISRNTTTQLTSYLEDLNREVEWLEIQQFDILQDSEVNKLVVTWDMMDEAERKSSMDYLLHRLTSIKNSSAYMKDVTVHIRVIHKSISGVYGIQDYEQASFDFFRSVTDRHVQRIIHYENSLYISAAKYGGRKGEEPLFLVAIELDPNKLRETLQQVSLYPDSGSFLIADSSGYSLVSEEASSPILEKYNEVRKDLDDHTINLKIEDKGYLIDKVHSDRLGLSIATYIPEEVVRRPLSRFSKWAWLYMISSVFAVLIYSYFTYRTVHKPLLLLIHSFKRMEKGVLNVRIEHEKKDEFGYLYDRFNQMLLNLQTLIDQDFKQKLMMQKSELKQLQSQINPHFLYNSFFILNSLARTGDVERIELFTNMLGEYFRFITRDGEDRIPLSEEIRHSRMYTEIQKLRFSRRIQVQFDELPEELKQIKVPRLILQPIIENAYEHSLEKMTDEGFLRITFAKEEDAALLIVEDNGNVSDYAVEQLIARLESTSEAQEMTGMINIHRRLLLTYKEDCGLYLSRSELNGLKVVIRIKLKEENSDV